MAQWSHTLSCANVFILRLNHSDYLYRLSTASPSTQSVFPGRGAKWLIYTHIIASDYHHNESLLLLLLLCTTKIFEQYAFALSRRVGALQLSIIIIICSRGNNLRGTITLWSRRVVPLEPLPQTRTKLKKKRKKFKFNNVPILLCWSCVKNQRCITHTLSPFQSVADIIFRFRRCIVTWLQHGGCYATANTQRGVAGVSLEHRLLEMHLDGWLYHRSSKCFWPERWRRYWVIRKSRKLTIRNWKKLVRWH